MPISSYQAIIPLLERILALEPVSILDVGVGFGKYGILLREQLELKHERYHKEQWITRIDGVEAYEGFRNPVHDYAYDVMYYQPLEDCVETLPSYDVILLIDVLEHMPKKEGHKLLDKLLARTNKALILSTPLIPPSAAQYPDNKFEAFLSRWAQVDFAIYDSHYKLLNGSQIVKLTPPKQPDEKSAALYAWDEALLRLLDQPPANTAPLHIAYLIPHLVLTGGLKMLIEQIRWLKARGHKLDLYIQSHGATALPEWMPTAVDCEYILGDKPFYDNMHHCDVIVAGWYKQLPGLPDCGYPVMYWEQGSEQLFGTHYSDSEAQYHRDEFNDLFSYPIVLGAVSNLIADIFRRRFYRLSPIIPNGVDTELFAPADHINAEPVVLLVGNPTMGFKRFAVALLALIRAWNNGHRFKLRWICQSMPGANYALDTLNFPYEIVIFPKQEELPGLYNSADILLFVSLYEGFGMPPLEAMASGLAVVCTTCGGPDIYIEDGKNALLVAPDDIEGTADAAERLLGDEALRRTIAKNARETALRFSLDKSYEKLERVLYAMREQYRLS